MHSSSFLTGAALVAIAHATPMSLEKRNACDWQGVEPILYHKYGTDDCPPKFEVDRRGNCPVKIYKLEGEQVCVGFCEQTTEYKYGRESIFLANPYCHGPMSCSISDTVTVATSYTFSSSLNIKFHDVVSGGISGGKTTTNSFAHAQTKSISLKEGECGYFTFLPIIKKTCGKWTTGGFRHSGWIPSCDPGNLGSVYACAEQPTKRPGFGDEPAGDTIFVRVDCSDHKPLPDDKQDPAYRHFGVPLEREEYDALAEFFNGGDRLKSEIECRTSDKSPELAHCAAAFSQLVEYANLKAQIGRTGRKYWASYDHSCAIQIEYEADWPTDACGMKMADIAWQAAGMFNKCADPGKGKVGALRQLADGKCKAKLRITHTEGLPPSPISG